MSTPDSPLMRSIAASVHSSVAHTSTAPITTTSVNTNRIPCPLSCHISDYSSSQLSCMHMDLMSRDANGVTLVDSEQLSVHTSSQCAHRPFTCPTCDIAIQHKQQQKHESSEMHHMKLLLQLVPEFQSSTLVHDTLTRELIEQNQKLKDQVATLTSKLQYSQQRRNKMKQKLIYLHEDAEIDMDENLSGDSDMNDVGMSGHMNNTDDEEMHHMQEEEEAATGETESPDMIGSSEEFGDRLFHSLNPASGDSTVKVSFDSGVTIETSDGIKSFTINDLEVTYLKNVNKHFIFYQPLASMLYDMELIAWVHTFQPSRMLRSVGAHGSPHQSQLISDQEKKRRFVSYEALISIFEHCFNTRGVQRSTVLRSRMRQFIRAFKITFGRFGTKNEITNANASCSNNQVQQQQQQQQQTSTSSGNKRKRSSLCGPLSSSSSSSNTSFSSESESEPESDPQSSESDWNEEDKKKKKHVASTAVARPYSLNSRVVYNLKSGDKHSTAKLRYHRNGKVETINIDTAYISKMNKTMFRLPAISKLIIDLGIMNRHRHNIRAALAADLGNRSHCARRIVVKDEQFQVFVSFEGMIMILQHEKKNKKQNSEPAHQKICNQFIRDWKDSFEQRFAIPDDDDESNSEDEPDSDSDSHLNKDGDNDDIDGDGEEDESQFESEGLSESDLEGHSPSQSNHDLNSNIDRANRQSTMAPSTGVSAAASSSTNTAVWSGLAERLFVNTAKGDKLETIEISVEFHNRDATISIQAIFINKEKLYLYRLADMTRLLLDLKLMTQVRHESTRFLVQSAGIVNSRSECRVVMNVPPRRMYALSASAMIKILNKEKDRFEKGTREVDGYNKVIQQWKRLTDDSNNTDSRACSPTIQPANESSSAAASSTTTSATAKDAALHTSNQRTNAPKSTDMKLQVIPSFFLNRIEYLNGVKIESHTLDPCNINSSTDSGAFALIRVNASSVLPLHVFRVNNKYYVPIHQFIDLMVRYGLIQPNEEDSFEKKLQRAKLINVIRITGLTNREFPIKSHFQRESASTIYAHGDAALCAAVENYGLMGGLSKFMQDELRNKEENESRVQRFNRFAENFAALVEQVKQQIHPIPVPSPSSAAVSANPAISLSSQTQSQSINSQPMTETVLLPMQMATPTPQIWLSEARMESSSVPMEVDALQQQCDTQSTFRLNCAEKKQIHFNDSIVF